ncbi:MAG: hypothetical protein AAFQ40_14375 [Cyanobacteria bacterium J06623_5]
MKSKNPDERKPPYDSRKLATSPKERSEERSDKSQTKSQNMLDFLLPL